MSRSLSILLVAWSLVGAGCSIRGSEPVVFLGHANVAGYHVLAGAPTGIPGGDIGYLVTANGGGGYRVTFTDTAGSPAHFSGTITTDVAFDPTQTTKFSGSENVVAVSANQIQFDGIPGSGVEGVDVVSQTDPIYLDGLIDGSRVGVGIFFTGARGGAINTSAYDPVAFTSP